MIGEAVTYVQDGLLGGCLKVLRLCSYSLLTPRSPELRSVTILKGVIMLDHETTEYQVSRMLLEFETYGVLIHFEAYILQDLGIWIQNCNYSRLSRKT